VNDIESRIRDLINEAVDAEVGPRRPAPPFDPRGAEKRRRWMPWAMPLLAAACVAALVGGTVAVAHLASSDHKHNPPATTVVPAPTPASTSPTTTHTSKPSTSARTEQRTTPGTAPVTSASSSSQPPGGEGTPAPNTITFTSVGPVQLGMTEAQVRSVEPKLREGNFGTGCKQFFGQNSGVNNPMFNVLLTPPTNRVVGISAPSGYVTDSGVGVGATRAQIHNAYPGRHIEETSSQGGQVMLVQGPNSWIGFTFGSGSTVRHIDVGEKYFAGNGEYCVGGQ